jgi:hypothetical protein
VPAIATPASTHAAKNSGSDGATAMPTTADTASTDPVVITGRGPKRSSHRPAGTPTRADTTRPIENAAVTTLSDHPVSAAMLAARTGKA